MAPAGFSEADSEREDGTQKLRAWRVYQQVADGQTILKSANECLLCKVWTTLAQQRKL